MSSHDPFRYLKHKLWPKEMLGVKLAVWLSTTKSRESTWFPCVQVACYILLESFQWGLPLCFRLHFNWRFAHKEVMGPQNRESFNFGNFGTLILESQNKIHLDVGFMERHKVYYKGEGASFPQVRVVVSSSLPVTRPNTKSASTMH
jgi:hypothetical protein